MKLDLQRVNQIAQELETGDITRTVSHWELSHVISLAKERLQGKEQARKRMAKSRKKAKKGKS